MNETERQDVLRIVDDLRKAVSDFYGAPSDSAADALLIAVADAHLNLADLLESVHETGADA